MSKEKKRIKEQMLVNQAIASIKKQLNDLENSRKKYIAAAVTARECGIASQYNLAKNAVKLANKRANQGRVRNDQIVCGRHEVVVGIHNRNRGRA